ncbi:hypothetical protein E4T42_03060 [Aureobasidium subglaciale]|nr:hypothetical protein E4T38_04515 [Aureobasidium subglaciale]KAI5223927.1 hypothetical protein E4T40_04291 [Aureobasidium subglaciale]KAI5227447.1 hypothetical protein E4T41_04373 [Aureobasidium subglaciale]KAI5253142.1 hypothetical protein E4T42_03060 [Aureobasidium subglaciale]KAI5262743.1 hypothetical protein E4T46_04259 [Aureobasidium subglaciale]
MTTISVSTAIASATTTTTITVQTTSAVCVPPSYGYDYVGGYTSSGPGQGNIGATFPSFPDINDQQGCCAKCFETPNCFIYYLSGGCSLYVLNSAPVTSGSDQCPAGVALEYTSSGNLFGLGACAVYAGSG